ncbi:MAG: hypothetical protein J2P54_20560 [Bradyrhizobiaceae bacterium]|nr:hypothetical protein [Bradyrhizobiaceae bacterium]
MLTENERMTRQKFMPIAILEHHQMIDPVLDAYDICDQLGPVWLQIQREAQACTFTLDADCIQSINERIARSLGMDAGIFRNKEGWASFLDGGGNTEDGPAYNWMFSALYWDHLTKFRLSTAWLFTNAIRIQHQLPEYRLALDKLGTFLVCLSASGPPIYDGQTFSPENYWREME